MKMKKGILCLAVSWILAVALHGQVSDTMRMDSLARTDFSMVQQEYTTDNVTKAQGDSAYIREDYTTAIQIYEKLLEQGEAAEVYYNLGNSYYKTNDIARSILNYERALMLQPGNSDIRANLDIARSKTIDKVTPIPEVFFVTWIRSLINCLNSDAWAKLGIACFLLLLASMGLFFFGKSVILKKVGFIGALSMLFLCVVSNVFAGQQKKERLSQDKAIVLVPSITVRSTPSESGTSLFVLHEGHKVEIKDNSMHEWKEIILEDGKVGWVPASAIEII